MKFILVVDWHETVDVLSNRLQSELQNNKVLWLLSGGSNIKIAKIVADKIPNQLTDKLTIALVDERYGGIDHPDSNWQQLISSGFKCAQAKMVPTLIEGLSHQETVKLYDATIESLINDNDVIVAQLGIGDDGHIAGILPDSIATHEVDVKVIGYDSKPYKRITMTFSALRQINAAYAFVFGDNKRSALVKLKDSDTSISHQPAQILKELDESYVYNDQLGEVDG